MLRSDGLWGSLDDAEIVRQLSRESVSEAVPVRVDRTLLVGGKYGDNVTVLALDWETPHGVASPCRSAADSVRGSVFASTLLAELSSSQADAGIDDALIELPIAEIKAATGRSAASKTQVAPRSVAGS